MKVYFIELRKSYIVKLQSQYYSSKLLYNSDTKRLKDLYSDNVPNRFFGRMNAYVVKARIYTLSSQRSQRQSILATPSFHAFGLWDPRKLKFKFPLSLSILS